MERHSLNHANNDIPMRYFNFIKIAVWFLFLRGLVSIGTAKGVMDAPMDTQYGLVGVVIFALVVISAVSFLYAAINMRKYQWNGVIAFQVGIMCNVLFYMIDLYFYLKMGTVNDEYIAELLFMAIFLITFLAGNVYFKKRRNLFEPYADDHYTVTQEYDEDEDRPKI